MISLGGVNAKTVICLRLHADDGMLTAEQKKESYLKKKNEQGYTLNAVVFF